MDPAYEAAVHHVGAEFTVVVALDWIPCRLWFADGAAKPIRGGALTVACAWGMQSSNKGSTNNHNEDDEDDDNDDDVDDDGQRRKQEQQRRRRRRR
jgi:hypothetical protein